MTKLENWRIKRLMSIQDLADISGINRATISRIERGVSQPFGKTLGKLSQALNVEPVDLIDRPDNEEIAAANKAFAAAKNQPEYDIDEVFADFELVKAG